MSQLAFHRFVILVGIAASFLLVGIPRAFADFTVVTVTPVNCGQVRVNDLSTESPSTCTVTIRNGGAAATISSASFGTTQFSVVSALAGSVATNAEKTLAVEFNPNLAGARPDSLSLTFSTGAPLSIPFTGTGTLAILVAPNLSFGIVEVGASSTQQLAITRQDPVGGVLKVKRLFTIGAAAANFRIQAAGGLTCNAAANDCSFATPISVGAGLNVGVSCAPTTSATGNLAATLTVESDTDPSGLSNVQLTCTAGRAQIVSSASALAFGSVAVGGSGQQSFTIDNTGNVTLNVTLSLVAGGAANYTFPNAVTVNPGSSVTVNVTLAPSTTGARNATLRLISNDQDPADSPINISLTGTGTAAVMEVTPTALAFANIVVGSQSTAQQITVRNSGTTALNVTSATVQTGSADYVLVSGPATAMIAAGGSQVWTVACAPSSIGSRPGVFRVTSDNSFPTTTRIADVAMSCNGIVSELSMTPSRRDFGNQFLGSITDQSITISNDGNAAVTGLTLSLTGDTTEFAFSALPTTTLAAGQSLTTQVRYVPTMVGTKSAKLVLNGIRAGAAITPLETNLVGTGVVGDFSVVGVAPNTDLTAFRKRFDIVVNGSFQIRNLSAVPLTVTSVTFEPSGVTTSALDFVIDAGDSGSSQLPANGTRTVRYTVAAINRMGIDAIAGQIRVNSNLPQNGSKVFPVAVNSTSAIIATEMPTFENVDVDAPTGTVGTVTITNTMAASDSLEIISAAFVGAAAASFSIDPFTAITLSPGQAKNITVTYKPTAAQPPGQYEQAMLRARIEGAVDSPMFVDIPVRGHGIDRTLSISNALSEIPSFRNPGSKAPTKEVKFANLGEAPLIVTPSIVEGGDVWSVQEAGTALTIAPGAEASVRIQFSPTASRPSFDGGLAFAGKLQLLHNDNNRDDMLKAKIDLRGLAVDRKLEFSQGEMVFEPSAAGVPILWSASLRSSDKPAAIDNQEIETRFQITKVEITSQEQVFSVVSPPNGQSIDPLQLARFDVEFAPIVPGSYEAMLSLYVDEDPLPVRSITVKARAIDASLQGSGCRSGDASSGIGTILLMVLAMAVSRGGRKMYVAAFAAVMSLHVVSAFGETRQSKNLDLAIFKSVPTTTPLFLSTESPRLASANDWSLQLAVSLLEKPLVGRVRDDETMTTPLIRRRGSLELGGSYVFLPRLEMGIRLPLYVQSGENALLNGFTGANGSAIGDLSLHFKANAFESRRVSLGGAATLTLPTATKDQLAGVALPTLHAKALLAWHRGALHGGANVGFLLRSNTQYASSQASELTIAVAASATLIPGQHELALVADGFGGASVLAGTNPVKGTFIAMTGVRYRMMPTLLLSAAVGRGIIAGPGTPSMMGMLQLTYQQQRSIVERAAFVVPRNAADPDNDGIKGEDDRCPLQAEDDDAHQDEDGCPDPDNDFDGIADGEDKCPTDKEDKDGFADNDGCVDPDNDRDGQIDSNDTCPDQAEDGDGFEDQDGCPDPDNDKDGMTDAVDKCPLQSETINGITDSDGCPDAGEPDFMLSTDRIELLRPITFAGSTISKKSSKVLGQIASILQARPGIKRVRVIAHVNEHSNKTKDLELSQLRAEHVRDWLVQWGIAASRIEVRGFGSTKMLVQPLAKNAAALNDRVEIILIEVE